MPDIVTMGELLIDFIPMEKNCSLKEVKRFTRAAGGAPANVAVGLSKVGVSAGFMGKIGNDAFGDFLLDTIKEYGVDAKHIVRTDQAMTTLAFVSLTDDGERDFAFYRKPGADMLFTKEDIDLDYLSNTKIFHFGSLSLTAETIKKTTYYLLKKCHNDNIFISFDPNIRLPLWDNNISIARNQILQVLPYVSLLKISLSELEQILDFNLTSLKTNTIKNKCRKLIKSGPDYIFLTGGKKGAWFISDSECYFVEGENITVKDTTGAGDSFMAGVLSYLLDYYPEFSSPSVNWLKALKRGNKFGALASSRYGAIPSLPSKDEI